MEPYKKTRRFIENLLVSQVPLSLRERRFAETARFQGSPEDDCRGRPSHNRYKRESGGIQESGNLAAPAAKGLPECGRIPHAVGLHSGVPARHAEFFRTPASCGDRLQA